MRRSRVFAVAAVAGLAATGLAAAGGQRAAAAQPAQACTSWQLVPSPAALSGAAGLGSVTPLPAGNVMFTGNVTEAASGLDGPTTVSAPLALSWDGHSVTEGTQVPADPARGVGMSDANTAGWISSFDSAADGWSFASAGTQVSELADETAEHWHNGRWTLTPLQTTPQATLSSGYPLGQFVYATAALSPGDAWAVGELGVVDPGYDEQHSTTDRPLIEHWDGTQWQVVQAAAPSLPAGDLLGIAAVSPTDIWAVGAQYVPGANPEPLIEHWDGKAWTAVPAPPGQGGSYLWAVSADGSGDVWAVGAQDSSVVEASGAAPLAEHWDGSSWTVQQLPDADQGLLTSVYAASPDDVWALGQQLSPFAAPTSQEYQSVFLHWDGTTWTTVPLPGPQEYGLTEQYTAIAGTGAGDVWAAGTAYDNGNGGDDPLIAHLGCQ